MIRLLHFATVSTRSLYSRYVERFATDTDSARALPNRHRALIALRLEQIEEQRTEYLHQKSLKSQNFGRRDSVLAFRNSLNKVTLTSLRRKICY